MSLRIHSVTAWPLAAMLFATAVPTLNTGYDDAVLINHVSGPSSRFEDQFSSLIAGAAR